LPEAEEEPPGRLVQSVSQHRPEILPGRPRPASETVRQLAPGLSVRACRRQFGIVQQPEHPLSAAQAHQPDPEIVQSAFRGQAPSEPQGLAVPASPLEQQEALLAEAGAAQALPPEPEEALQAEAQTARAWRLGPEAVPLGPELAVRASRLEPEEAVAAPAPAARAARPGLARGPVRPWLPG